MNQEVTAKYSDLTIRHNDWLDNFEFWKVLQDIKGGAIEVMKRREFYLPKRPGEELSVYKSRLAKLVFTPVMSTAIREFVDEVVSSSHSLRYEIKDTLFWERFSADTNSDGRTEDDLLGELLTCLLFFGKLSVGCINPVIEHQPRNRYELERLNIKPDAYIYTPLQVINWGKGWYITEQKVNVSEPLKVPVEKTRWIVWTDDYYEVYEEEAKVFGGSGRVLKGVRTYHNLGACPMVSMKLSPELWVGNTVLLKQLQHFWIENNWTDSATIAGIIQRILKPRDTKEDLTHITNDTYLQDLKTGNPYTIIAEDFQFRETTGAALSGLQETLDKIERQIKELVSKGNTAVINKGVVEQSGRAKEVDRIATAKAKQRYGAKLASLYQSVVTIVAKLASKDVPQFSGLSSYGTDSVDGILSSSILISQVEDRVAPTALKLWYERVSTILAASNSPDVDTQILKEIEDKFSQPLNRPVTVGNHKTSIKTDPF